MRQLRPQAASYGSQSAAGAEPAVPGGGKLHYLRTKGGAEVDFIVARGGRLVPIEVKWTEHPTLGEARHVSAFLDAHKRTARRGYLVCRCQEPLALDDRVTALPWSWL